MQILLWRKRKNKEQSGGIEKYRRFTTQDMAKLKWRCAAFQNILNADLGIYGKDTVHGQLWVHFSPY